MVKCSNNFNQFLVIDVRNGEKKRKENKEILTRSTWRKFLRFVEILVHYPTGTDWISSITSDGFFNRSRFVRIVS